MTSNRSVQHDIPQALFERPASAAVARFFGARNLLRGHVTGGQLALGTTRIDAAGPDGPACFAVRPERVRLDPNGPLRQKVVAASYAGTHVRLELRGQGLALEAHVPAATAPPVGEMVGVALHRDDLWRLPDAAAPAPTERGPGPAERDAAGSADIPAGPGAPR
jgi:putative spermidine/putrescine transport system ATP-binding protein